MKSLAIVGYRKFTNYEEFCNIIELMDKHYHILTGVERIISGGEPGVDTMAERWSKENGYVDRFKEYSVNWNKYGNDARPIRTKQIIDNSTSMLALRSDRSRGTNNAIRLAQLAGKKVYIVHV